jgi:hypothetical protein
VSTWTCGCERKQATRKNLVVTKRRYNTSAFNGYRYAASAYSSVECTVHNRSWRTKAKYVEALEDQKDAP